MNRMSMRMEKARSSMDSAVRNDKQSAGKENRTGIPAQLKERLEQSTGISLDDVRVHYNSALPARLDAWAYTKGNEVEIGPGQEHHLPHELGHVVQQKLGAVRANAMHSSGVALNTDPELEHQADEIGAGKGVEIASAGKSEIIQCAHRDRKKEKWKQGRGRSNWKHGRKNGFDMKHPAFEEDTDTNALRPIVSEKLREVDFDETHYLALGPMLFSLYYSDSADDDDLKECLRTFCLESIDIEQIFEQRGTEILERYPKIRARITETGNCGEMANFLYEVQGEGEGEEESYEGDFDAFIKELGQEVPENRVKLIRANANIGHAFTLICYKTDNKTVIELIQAWHGEYSVRDSLEGENIYINHDLARMFDDMHKSIRKNRGKHYLKEVFLLENTKIKKEIKNFDITDWKFNILPESPKEYADRIASKKI